MATSSSPFARICMSLSGGGFRSAAFSLGNLAYLHHLHYRDAPLLERVATITTASGGTFPGLRYARDRYLGIGFEDTYAHTLKWLYDTNVFEEALSTVRNRKFWKEHPYKRRSLINSAAKLYQDTLFEGARLDVFLDKKEEELPPLKSFIGTSTEFKEGLSFRLAWTREKNTHLLFGTHRWDLGYPDTEVSNRDYIAYAAQREIRLGDIAAASSAFPGAFEPLAFPDDFCGPGCDELAKLVIPEKREKVKALRKQVKDIKNRERVEDETLRKVTQQIQNERDLCNPSTALMDGGILDNQALGAAFYAERKLAQEVKEDHYHSLFLVADNASYFVSDFEFGDLGEEVGPGLRGWRNIGAWVIVFIFLFGLGGLWLGNQAFGIGGLVTGTLIGGALWLLNDRVKRLSRKALNSQNLRGYWSHLVKLPIPLLGRFLKERAVSIFLMVEQVFLKQIRSLYQNKLYEDPTFEHRRAISHLYLFLQHQPNDPESSEHRRIFKQPKISPVKTVDILESGDDLAKVHEVVNEAYSMPLTLWFSDDEQARKIPHKLCITGQLTACATLIHHMINLGVPVPGRGPNPDASLPYHSYDAEEKAALDVVFQSLLDDWNHFKADPWFLARKLDAKG